MIRLRQQGVKNGQTYRLVLMDKLSPRDRKYIEKLGWYNPLSKNDDSKVEEERIDHWLSLGATLSDSAESIVRRACPALIKKYDDKINKLVFVTCCGSPYNKKDDKFGHGLVFKELKVILQDKCTHCQAFPIDLVLPEDQKEDPNATMKTRLEEANFKGEIKERFDAFIETL